MKTETRNKIQEKKDKNTVIFSVIFMFFSYLWGIARLLIGIFENNRFYGASGISGILLGLCKTLFVLGVKKDDQEFQEKIFKAIAILIIVANALYISYMISLYFYPTHLIKLPMWINILICCISFADLGLAIIGIIKNISRKNILFIARECLSLVWAFQAIVFSLASLISAMNQVLSATQISSYNASLGLIYGILSIFIGIVMLVKFKKYKSNNNKIDE
jgi:hypothetical protein